MTAVSHDAPPTFEDACHKAPFSELIRLALSLAGTLVKLRARLAASAPAGMGRGQHA